MAAEEFTGRNVEVARQAADSAREAASLGLVVQVAQALKCACAEETEPIIGI